MCQCPHGLIPHCYLNRVCECGIGPLGVNALTGLYLIATWHNNENNDLEEVLCQCPHGLIPHCYEAESNSLMTGSGGGVNALTGLYLIATYQKR